MQRVLQIVHLCVLLAAIAFLGVTSWQAWKFGAHLEKTLSGLDAVESELTGTVANLNRPCSGPKGPDACGALAQLNKTAIAIGDIANASEISVRQSAQVLAQTQSTLSGIGIDIQEETGDLRKATQQATGDLATANTSIAGLAPLEEQATASIGELHTATIDLEQVINNPDISRTLAATADTTQHLDATAADVQQAVHAYTHPGWKTRVVNWSLSAVHAIGGWF